MTGGYDEKYLPNQQEFWDPEWFCAQHKVKALSNRMVPFHLNSAQAVLSAAVKRAYAEKKWVAHVKPRREGSSTFFVHLLYQHTGFRSGSGTGIIGNRSKTAVEIARIAIRAHSTTPAWMKPRKLPGLKRSLEFPDIDSWMTIESVGADEPFRGEGLSAGLATEICKWNERSDALAERAWVAMRNAVSEDGGILFAESTPSHFGDPMNAVFNEAEQPDSPWIKVFIPWTMIDRYRRRPPKRWIANPEVRKYADTWSLDEHQAYWMQAVGLPKCNSDLLKFRAEYPISEADCWVLAGETVFNKSRLLEMLKALDQHTHLAQETSDWAIYKEPVQGHRYVMGVDPASSWSERDNFGVALVDINTCEVVATYLGHKAAYQMSDLLCGEAKRYNTATVYVEANGVGDSLLSHMISSGYPRVFHRQASGTLNASGRATVPGWWSSHNRKAESVSITQELIDDGSVTILSRRLLQQLLQYRGQWDGMGRDARGGHFDLVAAFCIAMWAWKNELGSKAQGGVDRKALVEEFMRKIAGIGRTASNSPWGAHK